MSAKQYLVDQSIILRSLFEVTVPLHRLRRGTLAASPETSTHFLIISANIGDRSGPIGDMTMLAGVVQSLHERFTRLVGVPARLCADSGFPMKPASSPEPETETWITAIPNLGRTPVGANLGAHALAHTSAQSGTNALVTHIANQLKQAGERNALTFMLIPRAPKPQSSDYAPTCPR